MSKRISPGWWLVFAAAPICCATIAIGQTVPATETIGDRADALGAPFVAPTALSRLNYLNWSDLPLTISASQSVGYNDNILGLAQGQTISTTPSRGDLFSTTVFGASTKVYLGSQQFFADGSYGLTRYRVDTVDDTHQYSLDAGLNWQITSLCSGRVVAAVNEYQSPIEELIAPGINTVMASSLNETAKCIAVGYTSLILDSGWSSTQNSNATEALDDYDSVYVRSGVEYALTGLDTISALTTFTQRTFTGRATSIALPTAGLASGVEQIDYKLLYHRVISPKITFDGMVGVTQITTDPASSGTASTTQSTPVYSAALTWQPTPKLSIGLSSARSVGAPTSVLANAETTTTQSATINYQLAPKISAQAGIAETTTTGGTVGLLSGSGTQTGLTEFYRASYLMTPFVTATASYTHSNQMSVGLETKDNIFLLGISYRPQ